MAFDSAITRVYLASEATPYALLRPAELLRHR
jgi:hypothetical protein